MSYSVKLENVTKKYKMHSRSSDKLKGLLFNNYGEDFYAVQNINFEAYKGDVVGIIGINGSGKSTLSNLIAKVSAPTSGNVDVKGEVSLIAVARGLNKELTGRENIELKCLMMGFNKDEIERMKPDIIEFAELGKFIDMPVKKYSSGMKSRLGFAISVSIDPDVLIIDEALSVGDQTFADKSFSKLNEFKENGKTIFFVSHSAAQVKKFCTKALWIEHGEVKDHGSIDEVLPKYVEFIKEYKKMSKKEQLQFREKGMEKQSVNQSSSFDENIPKRKDTKKKGSSLKTLGNILGLFLLISLVSLTYINKDWISATISELSKADIMNDGTLAENETTEDESSDAEENEPPPNPLEELDIRYVSVPVARVRDEPTLSSNEVSLVNFGYPFIVKDKANSEDGDTVWSKTTLEEETIWISDSISENIPFNKAIDQSEVEDALQSLMSGSTASFEDELSLLGKSKSEVDSEYAFSPEESTEVVGEEAFIDYGDFSAKYNEQNKVSQVKINDVSFSIQTMKDELGEAHLEDDYSSLFIYRSNQYDYKLQSTNGVTIDRITIISPLEL